MIKRITLPTRFIATIGLSLLVFTGTPALASATGSIAGCHVVADSKS